MTKSRIIGHRGAAGLELENTLPAFQKAADAGVKIIEFDVRATLDNQLVVAHDDSLERVSDSKLHIRELTLEELRAVKLRNGAPVPTLKEVMELARKHHFAVIIEVKAVHDVRTLCNLLDTYQDIDITMASFQHELMAEIRSLRPNYKIYLSELHEPFGVLRSARKIKAQGLDLHYMLINPFTYLLAQIWHLDIMLFTVNKPLVVRVLRFLYPNVYICTNYPNLFVQRPRLKRTKQVA
jgi:glycerophosphoryl diester phosphodiesterase